MHPWQAWSKASLKAQAPNILNLIDRFNQVSQWVGTEILREQRLKERAKVLRCFIDIAWECFEINCFNVVQAGPAPSSPSWRWLEFT